MFKRFFGTVGLAFMLAFGVTASAEVTVDPANKFVFVCSDGHKVRQTPFNQSQSPEQLCGEAPPTEVTGPEVPFEFELIFGERPTGATAGVSGIELQAARNRWDRALENFGGVVDPLANAEAAEKFAIETGFGAPVYYLRLNNGQVYVAFPDSLYGSAVEVGQEKASHFVNYAGLVMARLQVRLAKKGVCAPDALRAPFARFYLSRVCSVE